MGAALGRAEDLPERRLMEAGQAWAEGNRQQIQAHIADHERRLHQGEATAPTDQETEATPESTRATEAEDDPFNDDVMWAIVTQSEREGVHPLIIAEDRGLP